MAMTQENWAEMAKRLKTVKEQKIHAPKADQPKVQSAADTSAAEVESNRLAFFNRETNQLKQQVQSLRAQVDTMQANMNSMAETLGAVLAAIMPEEESENAEEA